MKISGLSKSTAWYSAGNLLTRLTAFLLLPLYSNLIPPDEFGRYSLIASSYVLAGVLFQWGMQGALMKFYLEEKEAEGRKLVFSTIFNFIINTGIILTILIIIFAEPVSISILKSPAYSPLIKIAAASLLFDTAASFITQLLRIKEEAHKVVLYLSAGTAVNVLLNVYFIYFQKLGIEGILIAQLLTNVLLAVLMLHELKHELVYRIDNKILKKVFTFSLPFFAGGFFAVGVDVVDRFIIEYLAGQRDVGIYSLSYRIAIIMNIFVISMRAAWTPYSIRRYNEGNYSTEFGSILTKTIAVSLFIFLLITLLAPYLFEIRLNDIFLFNPEYKEGVKIIPIVLLAYLLNAVISYFSVYPYVSGKSYHFLISDVIAFGVNIPLNFILIPVIGISGAAAATFASYLMSLLYLMIVSKGKIKVIYEIKKIVLMTVITGALLLTAWYFNSLCFDIIAVIAMVLLFPAISGFKLKNLRINSYPLI